MNELAWIPLSLVRDPTGWPICADFLEDHGYNSDAYGLRLKESLSLPMVWCPPGSFLMGSPKSEQGRHREWEDQVEVNLPYGFWISQYPVTQADYFRVIRNNPSSFLGNRRRPVEQVSWHDANRFCVMLSRHAHVELGMPRHWCYSLPNEAQWEYACRAGSHTSYSFGDDVGQLADYAWYQRNSGHQAHPVGAKKPNVWGIYDMHGNVEEWCGNVWSRSLQTGVIRKNEHLRPYRGGAWRRGASECRSANRGCYASVYKSADLGFRVVLSSWYKHYD